MERIVVQSKEESIQVLSAIKDVYATNGFVRESDIYETMGWKTTYTDVVYGWTDISKFEFMENAERGTFELHTPPEVRLDNELIFANPGESLDISSEDPMVSHPPHYQSPNGMEVIDVIENFTTDLTGIEATDTGNIIKYICRWKHKNGLQDLKKAQWYLNHLITHIEKIEKESN